MTDLSEEPTAERSEEPNLENELAYVREGLPALIDRVFQGTDFHNV